jgi:hypothetical protein
MSTLTDALCRLAEQGYTATEAAGIADCSRSAARTLSLRQGVRFITEADRRAWRARDAIVDGLTVTEAAKLIGMERSAFHRLLRQRGIRFPSPAERTAAVRAQAAEATAAAKAVEDTERMARWREAWAARKAARAAADMPSPRTGLEAMAALAAQENRLAARRDGRRA